MYAPINLVKLFFKLKLIASVSLIIFYKLIVFSIRSLVKKTESTYVYKYDKYFSDIQSYGI